MMEKIEKFLNKHLLPAATWVAQNVYIQTLAETFMSLLPVIVVGAFCFIFSKSPISYEGFTEGNYWYNFFLGWNNWATDNLQALKFVNSATLGSLSLWVTVGIGYRWAKKYDLDIMTTIIVVTVNFLLVNSARIEGGWSTDFFGGEGLFSAIVAAFVICQLYRFIVKKGLGQINLPPTVPATLQNSMNSLLPLAICFVFGAVVTSVCTLGFGISIPEIVMSIGKPLNMGIDNPWAAGFMYGLSDLGYWFGIHTAAIEAVFNPVLYANLAANANAYAAGVDPGSLPYIVSVTFRYGYTGIGGSGATFGLVLLLLRSKSATCRTVGKVSIVPACFGINEPVVFGLPIMLNVTFLIPFVFVEAINGFIGFYAMQAGLLNHAMFYMGGTAPEILRSVLSNMDLRTIVYWVLIVLIDMVLWYPFFKMYENQMLEEEHKKAQDEESLPSGAATTAAA